MTKAFLRIIANEFCLDEANVPTVLKRLPDLRPRVQRIAVVRYLRPHLERMHPLDIQKMLDSRKISLEDLDFFIVLSEAMQTPPSNPPGPPRSWRLMHWLTWVALLEWLYTKVQLIAGLFRISDAAAAAEPTGTHSW